MQYMDMMDYSAYRLAKTIAHPTQGNEQVDVNTDPISCYYNEVFANSRNTSEPIKPNYVRVETREAIEYPILHFIYYLDAVLEAIREEAGPHEKVIEGLAFLAYSKNSIQFLIDNGTLMQEDYDLLEGMTQRVLTSRQNLNKELTWYATPFMIARRLLDNLETEAEETSIDINELKTRKTNLAQGLPQTFVDLFGEDILNLAAQISLR